MLYMGIYDVLSSYSKVDSVISLVAFIIAAVLSYLAYTYKAKLKSTEKIVQLADTANKADLARSLMDAFPTYHIPELTKQQGFEVIKMQFAQRSTEYNSKIRTIRITIGLLVVMIVYLFGKTTYTTYGAGSGIYNGHDIHVTNNISDRDTTHKPK